MSQSSHPPHRHSSSIQSLELRLWEDPLAIYSEGDHHLLQSPQKKAVAAAYLYLCVRPHLAC